MYNDYKTARDRVKSKKHFSWFDGNLTKNQVRALIALVVVMFLLAGHADYVAMTQGL